jgi:hypothetical protein
MLSPSIRDTCRFILSQQERGRTQPGCTANSSVTGAFCEYRGVLEHGIKKRDRTFVQIVLAKSLEEIILSVKLR